MVNHFEPTPNNLYMGDPKRWLELSDEQRAAVLKWVTETFEPGGTKKDRPSTYTLKHVFENLPEGFYITDGAMRGAFLVAGYPMEERTRTEWHPIVKRRATCSYATTTGGCCRRRAEVETGRCYQHHMIERYGRW